jgi:uncharacterized membrane protein YgcG
LGRWAPALVAVLTLAGLFWPLLDTGSGDEGPVDDPVTVSLYEADFDLNANGHLDVTETITADFPSNRHGIYRYWDVSDPSDPGVRHVPELTSITADGVVVPYETYWEQADRYFVAKIGDPDVYLTPGSHVYRIAYSTEGAISPATAGTGSFASSEGSNPVPPQSVFYWNVIAQGWELPIANAEIRISLPSPSGQVQCSAGAGGVGPNAVGPCGIEGAGSEAITLTAEGIPPRSGMTVRAAMALPPPERTDLPWSVTWDKILGRSATQALAVIVLSLIAFAGGLWWARTSREPTPGLPLVYEPPQGLGPVQTVFIDTEGVGDHSLVATLLYMADRGLVALEHRSDDSWLVTGQGTDDQWATTDPVTLATGLRLGVTRPGYWFLADGSTGAGLALKSAQDVIASDTERWARDAGLTEESISEILGRVAWWVALALAAIGFLGLLGGPTLHGLPFAAFALGGVGLQKSGVGARRTALGRGVWSRAGGFERLLSTPSSEDRFDFAARKDLFIAFIPYAVAFGVADRWAEKYRVATGQEPPIPGWYPYSTGAGYGLYGGGGWAFGEFDGALSTSIASYEASQAASSGGGGGFGGGGFGGGGFGGGGGGGGGGSW